MGLFIRTACSEIRSGASFPRRDEHVIMSSAAANGGQTLMSVLMGFYYAFQSFDRLLLSETLMEQFESKGFFVMDL